MQSKANDTHKAKMAAKAARNANPAAAAAQLAEINAPILGRYPAVQGMAIYLAAKHNLPPAACMVEAARMFVANRASSAAENSYRHARIYKENGARETDRRTRQISASQLLVTGGTA